MADPLTDFLMHDRADQRHASISPEGLELMGKEAANQYLSRNVNPNESIVKLASQYADINSEQVKRVVEFTNTSIYLAIHERNKTAGAKSSHPSFPLADAARIVQDMSDGARPTILTPTDVEYGMQPERKSKVSSARSDDLLADLFQVKEASEREMASATVESAYVDADWARESLRGIKNHLSGSGEQLDLALKEASAGYYDLVKRHLLDGGSFSEVMVAARSLGQDAEKVASVLKPVVTRLLTEKVASADALQQGVRNLEKLAHRIINNEHPLVQSYKAVTDLQDETAVIETALQEVDEQLSEVDSFISANFLQG